MGRLEAFDDAVKIGEIDDQRGVGAVVTDMDLAPDLDQGRRHLLGGKLGPGVRRQLVEQLGDLGDEVIGKLGLDAALAHGADVRQAHAVGRQHPGKGMDEDPGHAERVGDQTGVLSAGAAEAAKRVLGHVVAALDRYLLDRARHVLDRDLEEAVGDLDGRTFIAGPRLDLAGERGELLLHHFAVERLGPVGAEHPGEELGPDLAEAEIGVGHRQRPGAAIAGRPRIGARRIGADPVARAVEMEDRAAARRHRVDAHHRRPHAHAGDEGLEGPFVLAVEMGDVGRGAAHVEADDLVEPGHQ